MRLEPCVDGDARRTGRELRRFQKPSGSSKSEVKQGEKKHNALHFSGKVKESESIIDLSGFCWVFSIIKSAFRNIYIC